MYTINRERVVIRVEGLVFVKLFGYHEYYDNFSFHNELKPKLFVSVGSDVAIHYLLWQ